MRCGVSLGSTVSRKESFTIVVGIWWKSLLIRDLFLGFVLGIIDNKVHTMSTCGWTEALQMEVSLIFFSDYQSMACANHWVWPLLSSDWVLWTGRT
jgi:hypothetical protein